MSRKQWVDVSQPQRPCPKCGTDGEALPTVLAEVDGPILRCTCGHVYLGCWSVRRVRA